MKHYLGPRKRKYANDMDFCHSREIGQANMEVEATDEFIGNKIADENLHLTRIQEMLKK